MSTMRVKGKAQFRARQIVKADWKLSSRKVPAGTVSYLGGVLGWYYVEKVRRRLSRHSCWCCVVTSAYHLDGWP